MLEVGGRASPELELPRERLQDVRDSEVARLDAFIGDPCLSRLQGRGIHRETGHVEERSKPVVLRAGRHFVRELREDKLRVLS